jgi:hypothetical protein
LPEAADRLDRDDDGDVRCDVGACVGRWAGYRVHDRDRHQDHRGRHRDEELREHRRGARRNRRDAHRGACWNQVEDETSREAAE